MKGFRSTFVFAIIVAIIGGLIYWDYKNRQGENEAKEKESLLIEFSKPEITEISVKNPKSELLLQKDQAGHWQMLKPFQDQADAESLDLWLSDMLDQKGKDLTPSLQSEGGSSAIDWSKYYMSADSTILKISAGKKSTELQFGTSNAFDGSFYVKKGNQLLLGDLTWTASLEKDPKYLRNKDLYDPAGEIVGLTLQRPGKKDLKLQRKNKKWTLEGKPELVISDSNVETYIEDLKSLKASAIISDEHGNESLKKNKLTQASMILTVVEQGSKDPFKLFVGQRRTEDLEIPVYTSRNASIYHVSRALIERLVVVEDYFRDGRAPFKTDLTKVDKIKVVSQGVERVFEKKGETWQATKLGEQEEFQENKMSTFLLRLQELDAKLFLGAKTGDLGGDSLELLSGEKSVLQLRWGKDFYSPDVATNLNPLRYVKSNLSPELLAVRAASTNLVMQELPAVPKKSQNKEKPAESHGDGHAH